ncbi:glutathione S-transferase family protein [Parasphingopyxis marina]|uniref:Glutathione S-transferase family protein n=1 Tax=Parasphingopyxis marina TaxID=2761622 RepID=A0A842HXI8_9SPHN|nr:glutathione S-transferase family protein [Parasphingopyxis marina]MBC2777051.1 glutathione S-transferase family protein [Parasphingopyxis marina]
MESEIEADLQPSPGDPPLAAPVRLHWSPKSPFVRKVAIVIDECALGDRIARHRTVVERLRPNIEYMRHNPAGTIPALELADGTKLYDSAVICEYLLAFAGNGALLPATGPMRFEVLRRQADADLFLDAVLLWRQERIRPEDRQSDQFHDAYRTKARVALDAMEAEVECWPNRLDLGQIATGSALSYLDLRFPDLGWRAGRDRLSQWAARFENRESAKANRLALD